MAFGLRVSVPERVEGAGGVSRFVYMRMVHSYSTLSLTVRLSVCPSVCESVSNRKNDGSFLPCVMCASDEMQVIFMKDFETVANCLNGEQWMRVWRSMQQCESTSWGFWVDKSWWLRAGEFRVWWVGDRGGVVLIEGFCVYNRVGGFAMSCQHT